MPWASVEEVNYINSPRAIYTRQSHAKHSILPLMEGEDGRHGLMGRGWRSSWARGGSDHAGPGMFSRLVGCRLG